MPIFELPLQIRWSDLDPNFHLRHSVYYDWAAMCRMEFLTRNGLTPALMQQMQFGPIIFREEAVFRKEIKYGEEISINMLLLKGRRDYSRWTIAHEIKKADQTLCATVSIDGAWLNVKERKLFIPPDEVKTVFSQIPFGSDFEWQD
ncbi:MAG: acyl-CoA thioesterase [Chitinophagaceae bacterium]|nr:acyl-CoA thioesterase [Chitinophagaceae bacterium]